MEGPLFKKNAIEECHELFLKKIRLQIKSKFLSEAEETLNTLKKYRSTYFGLEETPLGCDPLSSKSYLLAADMIVYDLEKCIFNKSGIDYNIVIIPNRTEVDIVHTEVKEHIMPINSTVQRRYRRSAEDYEGIFIWFDILRFVLQLLFSL